MRKYHLFDAKGKVLGRTATEISKILSGKGKVDYTPHIDGGDFVVLINSDDVIVTGNKGKGKVYHHFSGYPGGLRDVTLDEQMEKDSRVVMKAAVYGMLPKNKLRDKMLKRFFVYKDDKQIHNIDIKH